MVQVHAWRDLALLAITFISTIFVSVEIGTLISVALSLLLVIKHTTTTRIVLLGQYVTIDPTTQQLCVKYKDLEDDGVTRVDHGLIIRFEEGLFFGNVGQLYERLKRIELHGGINIHPGDEPLNNEDPDPGISGWEDDQPQIYSGDNHQSRVSFVVFDMKAVSDMDASAAQTIFEIVSHYRSRHIQVSFVKVRPRLNALFIRSGITRIVGSLNFYTKIKDAVDGIIQVSPTISSSSYSPNTEILSDRGERLPFRSRQDVSPHEIFESFGNYGGDENMDS